jgi:hypothetical protein
MSVPLGGTKFTSDPGTDKGLVRKVSRYNNDVLQLYQIVIPVFSTNIVFYVSNASVHCTVPFQSLVVLEL